MPKDTRPLPQQLGAAFEDLQYPIEDEADFAAVFPDWASTRVESDGVSLSPSDLYRTLPDDEFPYETADELIEALLDELDDES
jgi:hypothetical protein